MKHIAVIGAGSWGTAVAGLIGRKKTDVVMWAHSQSVATSIMCTHQNSHYLADYVLPYNVQATTSLKDAVSTAETIFIAVPSLYLQKLCRDIAPYCARDAVICILTKGLEYEHGLLMSDVATRELGNTSRITVLSGPNHAEEVCRNVPSATVVAGETCVTEHVRSLLMYDAFRVYISSDRIGVQVCGAVKNVIAIACGLSSGLGAGDNTIAFIITRGLAEIGRLVVDLGGNPLTCMGLAGMGDLIATCTSSHSRNRAFGLAFSEGISLDAWERKTHMVVEGAHTVRSLVKLAEHRKIDVPIARAVQRILYEGVNVEMVRRTLMRREPTTEFYGILDQDDVLQPSQFRQSNGERSIS